MGFDTFNVGPELEYFLFEDDKGTETLDEGGYFAMTTHGRRERAARRRPCAALESMGIPIEYVHHEVGPSQHEIDMRFAPALEMADHTLTYRLIVKEIAKKAGYHATFMPKPIFGENGSGMHTHQSLFTDGRNAFFDADDKWHLSDVGKAFIAGPAPPRARDLGGLRAVGQLVQAARAGLRGAGLRRLVAAQPLGADPDPALQARQRAGDARGDPLPRPGLQPVPDLRGAAARGARGDRAGLRAARPDGDEPLPPDRRSSGASAASSRCRRRSARRSTSCRRPSSPARRSARTSSTATSSSSARSGTSTASSSREWELERYLAVALTAAPRRGGRRVPPPGPFVPDGHDRRTAPKNGARHANCVHRLRGRWALTARSAA